MWGVCKSGAYPLMYGCWAMRGTLSTLSDSLGAEIEEGFGSIWKQLNCSLADAVHHRIKNPRQDVNIREDSH